MNDLPKNIRSLTSARFIAAFSIILYHCRDFDKFNLPDYTLMLESAHIGVDFFFILSGFILTHSYLQQIQNGDFSYYQFVKRRFARIYPVHFVTLMAFCVLGFLFFMLNIQPNVAGKYALEAVPVNLLLLQAWGLTSVGTFNTPSWSISAEWFAYILFFPMTLLLMKLNKVFALVVSVAIMCAFFFGSPFVLGKQLTALSHDLGVIRIIPEFIYGIVLYLFLTKYRPSKSLGAAILTLNIAALIMCLHFGGADLVSIILCGFLIYNLAARSVFSQDNFLDKRFMVYLGEISYSMYMSHAILYTLIFNGSEMLLGDMGHFTKFIICMIAVSCTFPAAMICYHFIEEPCRKYINNRSFIKRIAFSRHN